MQRVESPSKVLSVRLSLSPYSLAIFDFYNGHHLPSASYLGLSRYGFGGDIDLGYTVGDRVRISVGGGYSLVEKKNTIIPDNCEFLSTYCSVRVFNSGFDNNNVTIKNSTLTGASKAFWVHNYIGDLSSEAHPDEAIKARLVFDIFGNNNTFAVESTTVESPIHYGFNITVYLDENGNIVE